MPYYVYHSYELQIYKCNTLARAEKLVDELNSKIDKFYKDEKYGWQTTCTKPPAGVLTEEEYKELVEDTEISWYEWIINIIEIEE